MAIFSKKHVYGQILKYLYDNPEKEFQESKIIEEIEAIDEETFKQIYYLLRDELIVKEEYIETVSDDNWETVDKATFVYYRISNKGYSFVKELENSQFNNKMSRWTFALSVFGFLLAVYAAFVK